MIGFPGEYLFNYREWEKQRPGLAGQSTESVVFVEGDRLVILDIHQQGEGSGGGLHSAVSGIHQQCRPHPPWNLRSTASRPIRTAGNVG